jgi:hypothetical protein
MNSIWLFHKTTDAVIFLLVGVFAGRTRKTASFGASWFSQNKSPIAQEIFPWDLPAKKLCQTYCSAITMNLSQVPSDIICFSDI